jgi:succinate dehydrogenase / fumarate reductase membrane anchor subunit
MARKTTHKGTADFIFLRASSVILLPLVLWFLYAVLSLSGADFAAARDFASRPLNAVLFALFIVVSAFHTRIGMAEIITDYIHDGLKPVLSLVNWLVALGIAGGALWAAYRLAF